MVYGTCNYSSWGESKPTNITGGPHIVAYEKSTIWWNDGIHRGWTLQPPLVTGKREPTKQLMKENYILGSLMWKLEGKQFFLTTFFHLYPYFFWRRFATQDPYLPVVHWMGWEMMGVCFMAPMGLVPEDPELLMFSIHNGDWMKPISNNGSWSTPKHEWRLLTAYKSEKLMATWRVRYLKIYQSGINFTEFYSSSGVSSAQDADLPLVSPAKSTSGATADPRHHGRILPVDNVGISLNSLWSSARSRGFSSPLASSSKLNHTSDPSDAHPSNPQRTVWNGIGAWFFRGKEESLRWLKP